MDYFAGLDISMDETHVLRSRYAKAWWFAKGKTKVDGAGDCRRIGQSAELPPRLVFETGRMA